MWILTHERIPQPADQAVGQPGDPAGDGGKQLPRDGGADALELAAVAGAALAAGRGAAQAAARAPRAPALSAAPGRLPHRHEPPCSDYVRHSCSMSAPCPSDSRRRLSHSELYCFRFNGLVTSIEWCSR